MLTTSLWHCIYASW